MYISYNIDTKSADLVLFTYARGLSITLESNKQQETYADMTTCYTDCRCSMDIVIPIGIHCYFDFDSNFESC